MDLFANSTNPIYFNDPNDPINCRNCQYLNCSANTNCNENQIINNQKIIQNQVRVSESEYLMNLASINIYGSKLNRPLLRYNLVNEIQSSDRNKLKIQNYNVPSHGNTTKRTTTSLKPGALNPGGKGVDVKHNSYNRYLGKLKAKNIIQNKNKQYPEQYPLILDHDKKYLIPLQGNKNVKYSIVNTRNCICRERKREIN